MRVAISVTKVFEVGNLSIEEVKRRTDMDLEDDEYIDWYDLEPEHEIWSYAILDS